MPLKKTPITDMFGLVIGFECIEKQIQLVKCNKSEADVIISKHHYSKKPTKNSFISFLVLYKGKVSGAIQLGYGIRPKIKRGGILTQIKPGNLTECI